MCIRKIIRKIREHIRKKENRRFLKMLNEQKENAKRIAVVGNVSSGKSFLIRDMANVLRRRGAVGNLVIFDIVDHSEDKKSLQTRIYLCRRFPTTSNHFYEASLNDKSIQILDMPGEAFGDDTHNLFLNILNRLITIGNNFEVVEYVKEDQSIFILKSRNHRVANDVKIREELKDILELKYMPRKDENKDQNKDEEEISKKIEKEIDNILNLKNGEQEKRDDLSKYLSKNYYHSVEVIELCCRYDNYQKRCEMSLTGREVVLNFLKYNTDSVMDAIYDVLADQDDRNRYSQEITQKKLFFWFYTFLSTDIIFCNRIAFPENTGANENAVALNQLYGIKQNKDSLEKRLFGNNLANKCNYYLVYRTVDMMINHDYFKGIYNVYRNNDNSEDRLYSRVASELFRFINSDEQNINQFAHMFVNEGYLINLCAQQPPVPPNLITMHRALKTNTKDFARNVTEQRNIVEDGIPCYYYVFFSSSAMDIFGEIHQNNTNEDNPGFDEINNINIDGDDNYNLCFGTRQLVLSLLYRSLGQNNFFNEPSDQIKDLLKMITGIKQE